MSTNANSTLLAALLADAKVGTFTGLVITKVGEERGPAGAKVRYGNDTVHACIFTGFKYEGLCQRSLDVLATLKDEDVLAALKAKGTKAYSGRGAKAVEVEVTLADMAEARAELVESLTKSRDGLNESTNDHVFEPLTVDGEIVRGCRVYTGPAKAGDVPAAKPGTIYLQGLQVSSTVLTPAPNGPVPPPQSSAKTVAKDALRRHLPIARYVSYKLEPGTDFLLRAGGTAEVEAEARGIHFTPEVKAAIARSRAA